MHKLPTRKGHEYARVGEDLGMVPHCVPDVMKQLGILSLEIQTNAQRHQQRILLSPGSPPYLSVITPSTHDMSTIRGWWEENRERTQRFYNHVLGQWVKPPFLRIVDQPRGGPPAPVCPAMWSIFQLQDILGMSETLRRQNPQEERMHQQPAIASITGNTGCT